MITTTTAIIIVTALVWLIWDVYLYIKMKSDPNVWTISMILTQFSWYSPALPFVAGFLMGHWFFPA
jgi:hypothetical protein